MNGWTLQDTLITITAVTSIGIFIQACVLIGVYFAAKKTIDKVMKIVDEAKGHVMPILATSRGVVDDLSPKIKVIANDITEMSHTVRRQTEHLNETVDEVVDRTRHQAQRMDGMVTGTLDGINSATNSLHQGITIPVRRVQGILNGVRAGLDVLLQRARTDHSKADRDMFV